MRKVVLRAWLLASLCIMFGILFAAPAAADEEKDWEETGYEQITVNTALRSQKNTKTLSSIVKIAKKGQIVEITERIVNAFSLIPKPSLLFRLFRPVDFKRETRLIRDFAQGLTVLRPIARDGGFQPFDKCFERL